MLPWTIREGLDLTGDELKDLQEVAAATPQRFRQSPALRDPMRVSFHEVEPEALCATCRPIYFEKAGWMRVSSKTDPEMGVCRECARPVQEAREADKVRKMKIERERDMEAIGERFIRSTLDSYGTMEKLFGGKVRSAPMGLVLPTGQVILVEAKIDSLASLVETRNVGERLARFIEGVPEYIEVTIPTTKVMVPAEVVRKRDYWT